MVNMLIVKNTKTKSSMRALRTRGLADCGIKLKANSNFVNSDNPFFKRGGNYDNSNAGSFYFNNNNGNSNNNNGSRVVCVIWHKIIRYGSSRIYIEHICRTSFIPSVKSVKI